MDPGHLRLPTRFQHFALTTTPQGLSLMVLKFVSSLILFFQPRTTNQGLVAQPGIDAGHLVEGDRGAGTMENRGGRWAGSGRRRSGMRESCEGGRREKNERH